MKRTYFHRPNRLNRAFTLLEIIVTIAIISILLAILIPNGISLYRSVTHLGE